MMTKLRVGGWGGGGWGGIMAVACNSDDKIRRSLITLLILVSTLKCFVCSSDILLYNKINCFENSQLT